MGLYPAGTMRSKPAQQVPDERLRFSETREGLRMNAALWSAQIVLTLIFLFTGAMKLALPIDELTRQMPVPRWFVRPLGGAELLGAIGVTLPWLVGVLPGLTPLAATGLVSIMIGATVFTLATGGGLLALIPLVVGGIAAFVAYGRWRLAPRRGKRRGGL